MEYRFTILPEARAFLRSLPKETRRAIGYRMHRLCTDLAGDVKKLTTEQNAYRLRVGSFRVLFRLEGDIIAVRTIRDRKGAYE